ncbi:MAG: DUF6798 domain-containing protein [Planctomycetota bacterium]|nr:DUF6798 domain-containing protein [Planctomycetota bacterium]
MTLPENSPLRARGYTWIEVISILAIFALHAAYAVPDSNEAHYLGKARHYWDNQWCAGDFFLESADAHQVFYWTFGWLTKYFPLSCVAWIGRWITWSLLAWSWQRLSWSIVPKRGIAILTAALFIGANERWHMAGEWVVGGVEAKGVAYALTFFAIESMVRGRWNRTWIFLGLASAFHVLVGGWAAIAAGVAWLLSGRAERPALLSMAPSLGLAALLALPSLWLGLALTSGTDASVIAGANQIYVFKRLGHHLDPSAFADGFLLRHMVLAAVWLMLAVLVPLRSRGDRTFRIFITTTFVIALVGIVLSLVLREYPDRLAAIMRYYWFRSSDAYIPVGMALLTGSMVSLALQRHRALGIVGTALLCIFVALDSYPHFAHVPLTLWPGKPAVTPRADKHLNHADWLDACRWARENSTPEQRFMIPRHASTFAWYAERPEVVNWKDTPQDATSIVEWWDRLQRLHGTGLADPEWRKTYGQLGIAELTALVKRYNIAYVISQRRDDLGTIPMKPIYENPSFAIYSAEQLLQAAGENNTPPVTADPP